MIKNFFYSTFLHFFVVLLVFVSFKSNSITSNNEQQFFVGFEHSVSDSTMSAIKEAKKEQIIQQNKLDKFISDKKNIDDDKKLKNELVKSSNSSEVIDDKISDKLAEKEPAEIKEKELTEAKNNNEENANNIDSKKTESNANTIESSGLSSREKTNILSQLKLCYSRVINESKSNNNLKFVVEVEISKDGFIQSKIDKFIDMKRYLGSNNNDYKLMIDNVKKALDLCSPLRNLPTEKYELWKNLILNFEND